MGTVILLSSSPPRPFAQSPTSAGHSSPTFASPSSIFGNGHRDFATAAAHRDGFHQGFNGARRILGPKIGSKNLSFSVPKCQQPSENASKELHTKPKEVGDLERDSGRLRVTHCKSLAIAQTSAGDEGKKQLATSLRTEAAVDDSAESIFSPRLNVQPTNRALSPLLLDKALPRRLDWTPPKSYSTNIVDPDSEAELSRVAFPGGLLKSFAYESGSAQSSFSPRNEKAAPVKRRKLDMTDNGPCKASKTSTVPRLAPAPKTSTIAPTKGSTSPKKKYATITALATSNYSGEGQQEREERPILQYLAATQAREIRDTEVPPDDKSHRKRAPKKPKSKKLAPTMSPLSPESAMKAMESQATVFGSASQLARDESPPFIRDIVETMKQSESSSACTPVPTQFTIPRESESASPQRLKGTSRFTKSRNLWASASRDEDNALLQVDTIDLFHSSDLRLAFTGKDAMLQPNAPRRRESASPEKSLSVLTSGQLDRSECRESNTWLDIDDIGIPSPRTHFTTKPITQTRTMHTAKEPPDKKRVNGLLDTKSLSDGDDDRNTLTHEHDVPTDASFSVRSGNSIETPRLHMPFFSRLTTAELSDHIRKYGLKPIRKREKMIEVLQRCWEAKHKLDATSKSKIGVADVRDEETEVTTHGDILTKVHSLTARPVPKIPKGKVQRAKRDNLATPVKPARRKGVAKADKDVDKNTKIGKGAEAEIKKPANSTTDKVPRKRNAKSVALSEEYVIDISDVEDSTFEAYNNQPIPLQVADETAAPDTAIRSANRQAVLSPILPPTLSSNHDSATPRPFENSTQDLPDINSQITNAITKYVASPTRDHQRDPTWHEKILMYDPIVLEDLAAWLNTEGLGLIGEDREVSALQVRSWCELKGVCCYGVRGGWRGNGKANARARGAEIED